MYPNPGLIPVCVSRDDTREEESPDVFYPGLTPVSVRRGDVREEERRRRALSTPRKGGGEPGVSVSGSWGRYKVRRH